MARFDGPLGLVTGVNGTLYVADTNNHLVKLGLGLNCARFGTMLRLFYIELIDILPRCSVTSESLLNSMSSTGMSGSEITVGT